MSQELLSRLERAIERLESLSQGKVGASAGADGPAALSPAVIAWEEYYSKFVTPVLTQTRAYPDLTVTADLIEKAFTNMGDLIKVCLLQSLLPL